MRSIIAIAIVLGLAACSAPSGLAPGLTARMDAPGAQLDRAEALNIVNQFRATRNAPALIADADLNTQAQTLAAQYASSGNRPAKPDSVAAMRISAGYATFAETFSGWRSTEADARALLDAEHKRAGIGVAYSANSTYGVHWVMLFGGGQ